MRRGTLWGSSRRVIITAASVAALFVTAARAEPLAPPAPTPVEVLDWNAPEGCPDGVALQQSLKDVLGEPLDFGRLDRVRGTIERRASDWALTLELSENGRRRTRLITARACTDLADAAALAIQLARVEQSEPTPADAAPTATQGTLPPAREAPHAEPSDAPPAPAARTGGSAARAAIVAAATLDFSALSRPAPGLSLGGRFTLARLELELYALALLPVNVAVRTLESVRFTLLAAGPRACYRALAAGALSAKPCIGFELGRFAADGSGLSQEARAFEQWWLAPNGGLGLELAANPWLTFEARGELSRPLLRRTYAINGSEVVYEPPRIGSRLYLGVSAHLP